MKQFINVAVAEKLAHLEHEEWIRSRMQPTNEMAARALSLLDKAGINPPAPGDEITGTDQTVKRVRVSGRSE